MLSFSQDDQRYMNLCFKLATQGLGLAAPNPLVGAVIVKAGKVIAAGYHAGFGKKHAECMALEQAGSRAKGATLYCNLEPCFQWGKQPPCTQAIIEAGIKTVIFAQHDPSDRAHHAVKILKKQGIKVLQGLLEPQAVELNRIFNFNVKHKKPLVICKIATSLDGKIATAKGESRWITSKVSREMVQALRRQCDAILVGVNTIIADQPALTVKGWPPYQQPLRVVLDSKLRIPESSQILKDHAGDVMILTTAQASLAKIKVLRDHGIGVKVLPAVKKRVDLRAAMKYLKQLNLSSVLVEGGAEVNRSFLEQKLAHELWWFMAPSLIPGQDAKVALGGLSIPKLKNKLNLLDMQTQKVGNDLLIRAQL
jgi:diaminohydroxyphosphoribosylaminopyrimidine deaminase/5-amino-6-(5-phosphoribosylamino)uracil reductase